MRIAHSDRAEPPAVIRGGFLMMKGARQRSNTEVKRLSMGAICVHGYWDDENNNLKSGYYDNT